jgi:rod shape-determining protein MreD
MILENLVIALGIIIAHILNGSNIFDIGIAAKPDFMIIFVLFFALRRGEMSGLWIGFLGGLLSDAALGGEEGLGGKMFYKIGVHALSFSIVGYFVGKFGRMSYNENYISISIFAFLISLIARFLTHLVFSFFFHQNSNYSLLSTSVYNAAIAPLTFFILTWIYKLEASEGSR